MVSSQQLPFLVENIISGLIGLAMLALYLEAIRRERLANRRVAIETVPGGRRANRLSVTPLNAAIKTDTTPNAAAAAVGAGSSADRRRTPPILNLHTSPPTPPAAAGTPVLSSQALRTTPRAAAGTPLMVAVEGPSANIPLLPLAIGTPVAALDSTRGVIFPSSNGSSTPVFSPERRKNSSPVGQAKPYVVPPGLAVAGVGSDRRPSAHTVKNISPHGSLRPTPAPAASPAAQQRSPQKRRPDFPYVARRLGAGFSAILVILSIDFHGVFNIFSPPLPDMISSFGMRFYSALHLALQPECERNH
jgi:hypothetical protein